MDDNEAWAIVILVHEDGGEEPLGFVRVNVLEAGVVFAKMPWKLIGESGVGRLTMEIWEDD